MKKGWKTTMAAAGVLFLLLSGTALAGTGIEPRREVTVDAEQITLGDVFAGVTEHVDHVLAPAPAPGRSMTLSHADLERVARAFNLPWSAKGMTDKTVIKSPMTELGQEAVTAALSRTFAEQFSGGGEFDVDFPAAGFPLSLAGRFAAAPDVEKFDYDANNGFFSARIVLKSLGGKKDFEKTINGRIRSFAKVPVLANHFRSGDRITAADIDYIRLETANLGAGVLMDESDLIGKAPRRGVPAMRPLQAADVEEPRLVSKGAQVIVHLKKGPMNLTMKARALEAGAEGDTIRVLNPASNKVVEAVVTAPDTVSIAL